ESGHELRPGSGEPGQHGGVVEVVADLDLETAHDGGVDREVQLDLAAVDARQDSAQTGLLRLAQRHGAGDGGEGAPTAVGGEAGELLDTTGRLGLRAAPDGPGGERGREAVRPAVQQTPQQGRATCGVVPLAVEGGGELTA